MHPFVLQMRDHLRVRSFQAAMHKTAARYCQLKHICHRCKETHHKNVLRCRADLCQVCFHQRFRCSSLPRTCSLTRPTHRPLRCRLPDLCHSFVLQAMHIRLRMPKTFRHHRSRRPCLTVALVPHLREKNVREHPLARCN